MPASIRIRSAYDCDLNAINDLENTCFSSPWTRRSIRHELSISHHSYNLCAVDGKDTVLGYLIGWKIAPEFHLGNLAVHPVHRSRGIATALCGHLLANLTAEEYEMASLEVREHNTAAIALYTGLGFGPVAMRKKYYADTGENALIMIKYLDNAPPPDDIVQHISTRRST